MREIVIEHIAELYGGILMVIFRDKVTNLSDVRLLAERYNAFMALSYPDLLGKILDAPSKVRVSKSNGGFYIKTDQCNEEISIEIDEDLLEENARWCRDRNITQEQLACALFSFCVDTRTHAVLRAWFQSAQSAENGERADG